uniref:Uncharacterized protein n=1 Tax=Rhodopseudomonas palustris (strain DX-1) TaxID=652103 RepID=E6VMK3_RHOPX
MADKKFQYKEFATEAMTARAPHLSTPHIFGEYADDKYKTMATAPTEYTARFQKEIQAVATAFFGRRKVVHMPWRKTKEGVITFNFKSPKKTPQLMDSRGTPLPQGITIRDGSLIRIAGVMACWQKGAICGVSLWPDAVRVIKLVEGFDASKSFGPPDEGYTAS